MRHATIFVRTSRKLELDLPRCAAGNRLEQAGATTAITLECRARV
jgi:hypothetical protein